MKTLIQQLAEHWLNEVVGWMLINLLWRAGYHLGQGANQQEVSNIGRCELGYLYIAGLPKTKEIWPT